MLEYWYKERRTLVDFRRGPLGPHFDGFAAHMKQKGYSHGPGIDILSKSCQFNSFLIESGVNDCMEIGDPLIDAFLDRYLENHRSTSLYSYAQANARRCLKVLFRYLREHGIIKALETAAIPDQYRWVLSPYLHYLKERCQLVERTIRHQRLILSAFLEGMGEAASPAQMKAIKAESMEQHLLKHLKASPENRRSLTSALRGFLRFCAERKYTAGDLSHLVPSVQAYRLATLPRGMDDSALQRLLDVIPKDTVNGIRDRAIMLLMMAYGIRGISITQLLLDDINWVRSTIRIRAQKGGKEVILPLLDAVGEALLKYLKLRPETMYREVFLNAKAPVGPFQPMRVSQLVRAYMIKAGVHLPYGGSHTLRHSWAIRALAHDSPMKAIADVLGHRCLNTTFIYAKADLKMLRQVAMPWPEGR